MRTARQRLATCCWLAVLLWLWPCSGAWAADQPLTIRAPSVNVVNGIYVLNAQLQFSVPDTIEAQIQDGATLSLVLNIRFTRERDWWRDAQLAELDQRYELNYHGVSQRFVLRNMNSGAQSSYLTLTEALVSMQHIEAVPLLDQNLIAADERNAIGLHAHLELHSIPGLLSSLLFWHSEFTLDSIWYHWPMPWPLNNTSKP